MAVGSAIYLSIRSIRFQLNIKYEDVQNALVAAFNSID